MKIARLINSNWSKEIPELSSLSVKEYGEVFSESRKIYKAKAPNAYMLHVAKRYLNIIVFVLFFVYNYKCLSLDILVIQIGGGGGSRIWHVTRYFI